VSDRRPGCGEAPAPADATSRPSSVCEAGGVTEGSTGDGRGRPTGALDGRRERWRRRWDREAATYDRRLAGVERRFFGDTRPWLCGNARGSTLEVAIGTGLNLAHYPPDVRLTGLEWSPAMGAVAVRRAAELRRSLDLHQGDAVALPFDDAWFDTVVCTFALCCIPDVEGAVAEMVRVVRPGGRLLLADHVVSTAWPVRAVQRMVDVVSVPLQGEHYRRRPLLTLQRHDVVIECHERLTLGMLERVVARKGAV
jgi:SAM-dependent methyltransferase